MFQTIKNCVSDDLQEKDMTQLRVLTLCDKNTHPITSQTRTYFRVENLKLEGKKTVCRGMHVE